MEQIVFIIPKDLQSKIIPLLKKIYENFEIIDSFPKEPKKGVKYVQIANDYDNYQKFEIPEPHFQDLINCGSILEEKYRREIKIKKEQQKLSLKYQNKHFKTAKK